MNFKVNEFVPVSLSAVDFILTVKTKGRTPHTAVLSKTASTKVIKSGLIGSKTIWAAFNKSGNVATLTNGLETVVIRKVSGVTTTPTDLYDIINTAAKTEEVKSKPTAPKKVMRKPKVKTLKDLVKVIDGVEYVRLADVQITNNLLSEAEVKASGESNSCAFEMPVANHR